MRCCDSLLHNDDVECHRAVCHVTNTHQRVSVAGAGVCGSVGVGVLVVLQVRLGCLCQGAEGAEAVVVAGWCVASSHVPSILQMHSLEAGLGSV